MAMSASSHAPAPTIVSDELPLAYTATELVRVPDFRAGLAQAVAELLHTHQTLPKQVRYVADVQKWMLSHAAMALHFESKLNPGQTGITAPNMLRFFGDTPVASRNTVSSFLMEMRHYRFIEPDGGGDRRSRSFRATADTEALMRFYFDIHLRALDRMDGGQRMARSNADASLFHQAQPRFARLLLKADGWWKPPETIAGFSRSDSGNSVIHDLASRVPHGDLGDEQIWIGNVSATEMSRRYVVSQTHTVRLFARAKTQGLIGWKASTNRGECWISPKLVEAYHLWQATKFAAIAQAVRAVCAAETASPEADSDGH